MSNCHRSLFKFLLFLKLFLFRLGVPPLATAWTERGATAEGACPQGCGIRRLPWEVGRKEVNQGRIPRGHQARP